MEFNERGSKLAVRPYTHTVHYWQFYFDTNSRIAEVLDQHGFPVPSIPVDMAHNGNLDPRAQALTPREFSLLRE